MIQGPTLSCDFCNGPHSTTECQMGNSCGKISMEQAQYLSKRFQPQFNPYSNNFNLGWRNYTNLSWRNNLNVMHPVEQVKPSHPQEKKASWEDTMSELAKYQFELSKSQAKFVNEIRTSPTNKAAQLRNLEVQVRWLPCSMRDNKAIFLALKR